MYIAMLWQVTPATTGDVTLDLNVLIGVATIGTFLVAAVAAYLTHKYNRKSLQKTEEEKIDRQIGREVEAKVGGVLISLRALEADARTQIRESIESLAERRRTFSLEVENREAALRDVVQRATVQGEAITELLERASQLLPAIETSEVVPRRLLYLARESSDDTAKTAYLQRVLEHRDADPRVLEYAGDTARQELDNHSLARRLYNRAFELDPGAISAEAEYLSLLAYSASERDEAKIRIRALAREHPHHSTVMNCLMNFFIRSQDYEGLEAAATEFLEHSRHRALLWRNIAVARAKLDSEHSLVVEAFEKAIAQADSANTVNAAAVYGDYLVEHGDLDLAETIVLRALVLAPSEAGLHHTLAEVSWARGDYTAAAKSLALMAEVGDLTERHIAARRLRDIEVLDAMGLVEGRQGGPETADGGPAAE